MPFAVRAGRRLVEASLQILFPADCYLCARPLPWRQKGSVCFPCWESLPWSPGLLVRRGPLRGVLWAADYDGPIRRLVHGFKFEGMHYLGRHLGEAVADRLAPLLERLAPELVVPVPLHWWRRYRRGYNQALLLAAPVARRAGLILERRALSRPRAGRRQLGLSRRDRLRSLRGCYGAPGAAAPSGRPGSLRGKTVLLVDDVMTTGATLEACARVLLRAGARSVVGCVLARTPRLKA